MILNFHRILKLEQVELMGEGEYNLNALTAIEVTDSYLGLDPDVKHCQNEEPIHNCTTRQYRDTVLAECECLPSSYMRQYKVYKQNQ